MVAVTVWFDYSCGYSHRAASWLDQLPGEATDGHALRWRPFSLKEVNRPEGSPSMLTVEGLHSTRVLALVLATAAGEADEADFAAYHRAVFAGWHGGGPRLAATDIRAAAARAGVDLAVFDREAEHWVAETAAAHRHAATAHGVFGTPTLVYDDTASVFLKLAEVPAVEDGAGLWHALHTLAVCHPELVEVKRTAPA